MKITKSNLYTQIEYIKSPKDHKGPGYDIGTLRRLAYLSTDLVDVAKLTITAQDGSESSVFVPVEDVSNALDRIGNVNGHGALKVIVDYGKPDQLS